MVSLILKGLVPTFFVIGLGYLAGKRRMIDNHNVRELPLVMHFGLPALPFVATATTSREKMIAAGPMVIASTICSMITLGGAILLLYPQ
jgi:malonate transporter